ncbi:TetR/AcrR family transcriptional regulator [Kitasatospora sp. NPDC051853]|uniref:TetR/AcrR family transcriptional regulator n=1 Tax=Kitasatospora sp. NPDC051853 TaxID=3364058 RepID=UPI0037A51F5D
MATRRPPGRKAQILAVAGERFHRDGYHRVSMAGLAGELGITAPALYRHVPGKSELLRQVLDAQLSALREATRSVSSAPDGPVALAAALAPAAIDHRVLGTLWQRDARLLPPAQRARLRRELRTEVTAMATAVRRARPELTPPDAALLCWSVLSALGGLSNHTFVLPRRRFERLLGELIGAVLAAPLPPRPSPSPPPSPPRPSPSQPPPGSRREELLTAAVVLFHRYGFDNVTTDRLGAAVGIAGPSVYKHFGTKAELLAAALERCRERLRREVSAPMAAGLTTAGGPGAALAVGLRAYVDFAHRHGDHLGVMVSETERLAPPDRRAAVAFRRDFLRTWVELLREVRPEYGPAEARIRVHAMFALVNDGVRGGWDRPDLTQCLADLAGAVSGLPVLDMTQGRARPGPPLRGRQDEVGQYSTNG